MAATSRAFSGLGTSGTQDLGIGLKAFDRVIGTNPRASSSNANGDAREEVCTARFSASTSVSQSCRLKDDSPGADAGSMNRLVVWKVFSAWRILSILLYRRIASASDSKGEG